METLANQSIAGNTAYLVDRSHGEHSLLFNFEKRISYHFIIAQGCKNLINISASKMWLDYIPIISGKEIIKQINKKKIKF